MRREKVGKPAVRDEVRLLRYLLDEGIYDTAARPVKNQSHPVEITMGMALAQLIEMVNICHCSLLFLSLFYIRGVT